MTKRGFLLLIGALVLTLAVMVGAWSYSMATVVGDGTIAVTPSPNALLGTPAFGLEPVASAMRGDSGEGRFAVSLNTANPVSLSVSVRNADSRLGTVLEMDGSDCVVRISPAGDPTFPIGKYTIRATVVGQGDGFRASVDVEIPVEVQNAPLIANDDTASTSPGRRVSIPVLANDVHLDGGMQIHSVNTSGTWGVVRINGNLIDFWPGIGFNFTTSFRYTVRYVNPDGTVESSTARVSVRVR